jgi:hypothetical protein
MMRGTAAAHVRLVVWCRDCEHRVEPDATEQAARYGAKTALPRMSQAPRLLAMRQPKCGFRADSWFII